MHLFKSVSVIHLLRLKKSTIDLVGITRLLTILLGFILSTVFTSSLVAQTAATLEPITTDAFINAESEWKSFSEYNEVIASELLVATASLNVANISSKELALYTGYNKMLGYMQADMAIKAPIETVAQKSFDKVLADVATDASLADLPKSEFTLLYANLLTKLITH